MKANILIDQTGRARLADFGLLTIISDPTNLLSSSSYTQGGTARWMSPELIAPQKFGFENSRPTKSSDCYALGMVVYETISGNLPFHKYTDLTVFVKVLEGERPHREDGFMDSVWEMLEMCWMPRSSARPSVEDVLQCLENPSRSWESPSSGVSGEVNEGAVSDSPNGSSGMLSRFPPAIFCSLGMFHSLAPSFLYPCTPSVYDEPLRAPGGLNPLDPQTSESPSSNGMFFLYLPLMP